MKMEDTVQNRTGYDTTIKRRLSNEVSRERGMKRDEAVQAISDLFEGKMHDNTVKNRIPSIGEYILVNECGGCFSRVHGGRYEIDSSRRYFGRVTQRYPHIIIIKTEKGVTSEKVSDIMVGLVRYVSLKRLPEHPEKLTYDEKLLNNFIIDFENLLAK